jgi:hypothetical protein
VEFLWVRRNPVGALHLSACLVSRSQNQKLQFLWLPASNLTRIEMKRLICSLSFVSLWLLAGSCQAGWYTGVVEGMATATNGTTVTFNVAGFARTNCTCWPSWGSYFCLDSQRETHKYEVAMVLCAIASGKRVAANIDEASCMVRALESKPN